MRAPTLALLLLVACAPAAAPTPDNGCKTACARLVACGLGVPQTRGGAPCEAVCTNAEANGVDFGVACLTHAPTCADAQRCN